MRKRIFWITETAMMLALLIVLQWATKPLGQLVTGVCVNTVLATVAMAVGLSGGLTVALLSPVFAFLLGIAPNVVTVPAIMAGNAVFVLLLRLLSGKCWWRNVVSVVVSAAGKFGVLYALVNWVICGLLADTLLAQGVLKAPMLKALPVSFGIMQLMTALLGGSLALTIASVLKKTLGKNR